MDDEIEIIGIYKVNAKEPCHLIEMMVNGGGKVFEIDKITQEKENKPEYDWEVPYLEHILDDTGRTIMADNREFSMKERWNKAKVRIVFFFHYLDTNKPLITPAGNMDLPDERKIPERLEIITYKPAG